MNAMAWKSRRLWLGVLITVWLPCSGLTAQEGELAMYPKHGALSALPKGVPTEPGKLTLFADFAGHGTKPTEAGTVWLYLINATTNEMMAPTQDGDLYCKRESRGADDQWRRCDTHVYSDCGNSYISAKIAAQSFIAWPQLRDAPDGKGKTAPLRFHMYQQGPWVLTSNEGTGRVTEEEIMLCRYDAMAMHLGPFEDVAAVATGKVRGGQGSWRGISTAISGLGRFPEDMRLFPVLKQVIASLPKEKTQEVRPDFDYEACLRVMLAMLPYPSGKPCWEYVESHVEDPKFPWRNEALNWLITNHWQSPESIRLLVETVLAEPGHPAMRAAMGGYSQVVEKHQAGLKLAAMAQNTRYSLKERTIARDASEGIFENPFLAVKVEQGNYREGQDTFEKIVLTNISRKDLTLPVSTPDKLLLVRVESEDGTIEATRAPAPQNDKGSFTLKPGASVTIKDFKWWTQVDPDALPKSQYFNVSITASTPGLWDVPAKCNSSWGFKNQQIQQAIDKARAE